MISIDPTRTRAGPSTCALTTTAGRPVAAAGCHLSLHPKMDGRLNPEATCLTLLPELAEQLEELGPCHARVLPCCSPRLPWPPPFPPSPLLLSVPPIHATFFSFFSGGASWNPTPSSCSSGLAWPTTVQVSRPGGGDSESLDMSAVGCLGAVWGCCPPTDKAKAVCSLSVGRLSGGQKVERKPSNV